MSYLKACGFGDYGLQVPQPWMFFAPDATPSGCWCFKTLTSGSWTGRKLHAARKTASEDVPAGSSASSLVPAHTYCGVPESRSQW